MARANNQPELTIIATTPSYYSFTAPPDVHCYGQTTYLPIQYNLKANNSHGNSQYPLIHWLHLLY